LESAPQKSKMVAWRDLQEMRRYSGGDNGFMSSLLKMYDEIRANLHSNKFVVGELLFVEYKCPIEQEADG
jgi:hypothetical protein